jgi:hypothetical protein
MLFIVLLLYSLSLFSAISTQNATTSRHEEQAREMARLGVYNALGQLSKLVGPDQRVTASAGIDDTNTSTAQIEGVENPYWVGVWDADADSATYGESLGWLVSGNAPDPLGAVADPVTLYLLRDPDATEAVKVQRIGVTDTAAVFDESQKAQLSAGGHVRERLMAGEEPDSRLLLGGAGAVDASPLLGSAAPTLSALYGSMPGEISRSQFALINDGFAREPSTFHDYTAWSYGVQADVRKGGLKRDLSLAFEMDGDETETNSLAAFNGSDFAGNGARTGDDLTSAIERNHGENFYARFLFAVAADNGVSDSSGDDVIRGPTWHLLRDYYNLYKHIDGGQSGSPSFAAQPMYPNTPQVPDTLSDPYKGVTKTLTNYLRYQGTVFNGLMWAGDTGVNEYASTKIATNIAGYLNRPTRGTYAPVMQRVIYYFSVMNAGGELALVMNPIVVFWNPYNVDIEVPGLKIIQDNLPMFFHVRLDRTNAAGTVTHEEYLADYRTLHKAYGVTADGKDLQLFIYNGTPIHFEPGEIKVFSVANSTPQEYGSNFGTYNPPNIYLSEGMSYGSGVFYRRFFKINGISSTGTPDFVATDRSKPSVSTVAIDLTDPVPAGSPEGTTINPVTYLSVQVYPAHLFGVPGAAIQAEYGTGNDKNNNIGAGQNNNYLITSVFEIDGASFPGTEKGYWMGDPQLQEVHVPLMYGASPFTLYADLSVAEQGIESIISGIGATEQLFKADLLTRSSRDGNTGSLLGNYSPRAALRSAEVSNLVTATLPQATLEVTPVSSVVGVIESFGSNAYWGDSLGSGGQSHVTAWELPTGPMLSLAGFQHADTALMDYQPARAIGNSMASPYLPYDRLFKYQARGTSPKRYSTQYDLSYLANQALWDGYFFSGLSPEFTATGAYHETLALEEVIDRWADPARDYSLPNPRMVFAADSTRTLAEIRALLKSDEGYAHMAANLLVEGGFNVNSVSVPAWKAFLGGVLGQETPVAYLNPNGGLNDDGEAGQPFSKYTLPNGDSDDAWRGFRRLNEDELQDLSEEIVKQVKRRGPFLSLADFVNRGLTTDGGAGDLRESGALQSAIDAAGLNDGVDNEGVTVTNTGDFINPSAASGSSVRGISGYLTQADVLNQAGPYLSARGDSFIIRAYGEVKSPLTGDVIARRWCEALVQRTPEYVDATANTAEDRGAALSADNAQWGRRLRIVSFRWLDPDEV